MRFCCCFRLANKNDKTVVSFFLCSFFNVREVQNLLLSLLSTRISSSLKAPCQYPLLTFLFSCLSVLQICKMLWTRPPSVLCGATYLPRLGLFSFGASWFLKSLEKVLSHAKVIQIVIECLISLFLYFLYLLEKFLGSFQYLFFHVNSKFLLSHSLLILKKRGWSSN